MPKITQNKEDDIVALKSMSEEGAVEQLFKAHYASLCRTVHRIVKDHAASEDIVQDVFIKMWNKRNELDITTSVKAYLFRSVINTGLNYINSNKKSLSLEETYPAVLSADASEAHDLGELEKRIDQIVNALPDACRTIFVLSREENMSYREIADTLDISIKTVENQIGKALKILRERLKDYLLPVLLILCVHLFLFI